MGNGYILLYVALLSIFANVAVTDDIPCMKRLEVGGYVCVCNETYCDTIEAPATLDRGSYYHYTTSDISPGFTKTVGTFFNVTVDELALFSNISQDVFIRVNSNVQYQTFMGVGASFSDSSGLLINSLPSGAKQKFLESFFGTTGLEYTIARVPMAASDFSSKEYTYDDVPGDEDLAHFNLTQDDFTLKIPLLKMAMAASQRGLHLIGTPWTAPFWMKTNNNTSQGYILAKYYHAWANYIIKFLEAYSDNGVDFWGITPANECIVPLLFGKFFAMSNTIMLPAQARYWTKTHLGPMLRESRVKNTKILTLDDERPFMNWWANRVFSDKAAADYIEGIALHWYFDSNKSVSQLELFHEHYPDKLIFYTESSINSFQSGDGPVNLGDWSRALRYINNIFQNYDHWVVGYTDWNIALNEDGGPTGPSNVTLDASVIINANNGEFYKQPAFYALGHFSKFISPGSKKIEVTIEQETSNDQLEESNYPEWVERQFMRDEPRVDVEEPLTTASPFPTRKPDPPSNTVLAIATINPDGSRTVIAYNPRAEPANLIVVDAQVGTFNQTVEPHSLNSFVYW